MTPTRVSVVLSTHQGAAHLQGQLDSLAAQTHLPSELVVRDDGSTDTTTAILEAFARDAPFPVHVSAGRRLGLAASLEVELAAARGDLVALCDQDDEWLPTKLARCVAALDAEPSAAAAFTNGTLVDDRGRAIGGTTFEALGFNAAQRHVFAIDPVQVLAFRSVVSGHALVVRRRVVATALPFPPALRAAHADAGTAAPAPGAGTATQPDRWLALVAAGLGPIEVIDEPLVAHRQHTAQATGIDARAGVRAGRELRRMRAQITSSGDGTRARLEERADLLVAAADRTGSAALHAAADHLRRRAALPARRGERVTPIVTELRRSGYRFSGGRWVALADLARPLG